MNNINKKVINIDYPCIQDIVIRKGETDVCFTLSDGQDETKLFLNEGEEIMFTVNIGNVSNIGFGGTDNWGKDRLPLYLGHNKDSENFDSILVDDITILEYAGENNWCKCELINNNKAVHYIALSENPTSKPRIAYFYHSTKDKTIKIGYNKDRPASQVWCVTVIQEGNPNKENISEVVSNLDLGEHLYDVGLITDLHICKANNNDVKDQWWDEDDFKAAMNNFVNNKSVKFIASCGDISEAQTNDSVKHPEATCETDYAEFTEMYDVPYWQIAGLRFFSPLGNHDFYGIFESRQGDTINGKKNTETIFGYNLGVKERLGNWPTGLQINGIVPGRGRIVFDLEEGKDSAVGLSDMNFFAYNGYVDIYAKQAGYNYSIWDANKSGISDIAISLTKNYVNSNWTTCKDNLSGWQGGSLHGRNGYSKLNYYLKKDNDIYIFLSIDYGNDIWNVTSGWHDRMIHARTIINLNEDDPYIKRMKEYVQDTEYSSADEPYNYLYYSPNTLIWLKEIIENNTDKKIFIFTHHYMPNRVGNSNGLPKNGFFNYAVISPAGELTNEGINKGSNCLTGIEFWFINKLLNTYKNIIWFSGHSHISWESKANIDNQEYNIVNPFNGGEFIYTKSSEIPKNTSAWSISLPSLSKPRYLSADGKSSRMYDDAEIGIMEVYEKGVKIKGYKIRKNNEDSNTLLIEKSIKLLK